MTMPGYVDYARTSLAGGFQLAGGQRSFPSAVDIFSGNVQSWDYINLFWNSAGATDHWSIEPTYYSDGTFSTVVATQRAIRGQFVAQSYRQFGVLGPWVAIFVYPNVGGDNSTVSFELYGTNGAASSGKIGDLQAPFDTIHQTVAASTTLTFISQNVMPGKQVVNCTWAVNTNWFVELDYYDWGSKSFVEFFHRDQATSGFGFTDWVTVPDSIIQVTIHNGNTVGELVQFYRTAVID